MKTHAPNLSECHGRSREARSTLTVSTPEGFCISASRYPIRRTSECVATPVAPSSYMKSCKNAGHSRLLRYASFGSLSIGETVWVRASLGRDCTMMLLLAALPIARVQPHRDRACLSPDKLAVANRCGIDLFKLFMPSTLCHSNPTWRSF